MILLDVFHFEECGITYFKMLIIFFKFLPKNTQMRNSLFQIRYTWFQISDFLVLHEIFHFHKHESADFKYENNFLKLLPKAPKENSFFHQISGFLILHETLRFANLKIPK